MSNITLINQRRPIMKKILLMLLCLITLSVFAGATFASCDANHISNNDSIQISDDSNLDISISENMTMPDNTNPYESIMEVDANQTIQKDTDLDGATNIGHEVNQTVQKDDGSNTPQLNITGPKINGSDIHIEGPIITGKGPILTISQKQKDIFHYASLFLKHSDWTLFNMCLQVLEDCAYTWEDTADIVAQAHNIAIHHYNGNDMKINHELTKQEVWDYMSQDMYLIMKHSGRS